MNEIYSLSQKIKSVKELGGKVYKKEWIIIPSSPEQIDSEGKKYYGIVGFNLRTEKITDEIFVNENTIFKSKKRLMRMMK